MTKPALIAVVGPTGTGKSDLAIKIAHALAASGRTAEIVNSDAMQLYRGMDIGTAKLSVAARAGVVHHLIDVYPVTKESTAADYQLLARTLLGKRLVFYRSTPGQVVALSVDMRAPPGSCTVACHWQMVDADNQPCFGPDCYLYAVVTVVGV